MPTRDPAEAEALAAILERVRAAKGPDHEIDSDLAERYGYDCSPSTGQWRPRDGWSWEDIPEFTRSIEAALALLDRVLPGADYEIRRVGGRFFGKVRVAPLLSVEDEAENEALALLAALLGALTAQLTLTHQEASHGGR